MATRAPLSNATNNSTIERIQQKLLTDTMSKVTKRKSAAGENNREEGGKENEEGDTISDENKGYYDLGRIFGRICDPFADVQHVVNMGIRLETSDTDEETEFKASASGNYQDKISLATWEVWTEKIPSFCDDVMNIEGLDPKQSRKLMKAMNRKITTGMSSIRSVDTTSLKNDILKYVNKDMTAVDPPITKPNKADRGWKHPTTAELLCPIEWPASEQTFSAISEGRRKVTARRLPRFLYPSEHKYDPNNIEAGLLEGHLLIRVAKHILQGPLAALERAGFHRGKRGNAQIMGVQRITPHMIAYLACQTRHALSSQPSWTAVDVHFDYHIFFWNIVALFEDDACTHVLDLFNYQVFGAATTLLEMEEEDDDDATGLDLLWAERARKRARLELEGGF